MEQPHIKSYVLRQARQTKAQARALESYSKDYLLEYSTVPLDFGKVFAEATVAVVSNSAAPARGVVLEIGFGMGHATAAIAVERNEFDYLGVEVHGPGVGALMDRLHESQITNVRIIRHDVVEVLATMIPADSLSGVHVFFPDPWPKKKHHKRRLLSAAFLENLARVCLPGAYLYIVTDWADYAEWILDQVSRSPSWTNPSASYAAPIPWRPRTAFEAKGLRKDHEIREIWLLKK